MPTLIAAMLSVNGNRVGSGKLFLNRPQTIDQRDESRR